MPGLISPAFSFDREMLIDFQTFSADTGTRAVGKAGPLEINLTTACASRVELGGSDAVRVTATNEAGFLAGVTAFHNNE